MSVSELTCCLLFSISFVCFSFFLLFMKRLGIDTKGFVDYILIRTYELFKSGMLHG